MASGTGSNYNKRISYKLISNLLRVIVLLLVVSTALSLLSPSFFRFLLNTSPFHHSTHTYAEMLSTVLLPASAILHLILRQDEPASQRRLAVDALFCISWFVFFWAIALYGLFNYSFL